MTASPRVGRLSRAGSFDSAAALLAVVLLHGTGCGPKEVTPAPTVTTSPSGRPKDDAGTPPGAAATEATPSLSAEQLAREVKRNPQAANAKYRGSALELSGVVDGVGQAGRILNEDGRSPYIKLRVPGDESGILCFLQDKEPWARVSPGSQVRVKGRWPESPAEFILRDCTLVEVGPNPAPVLSAEQLAKEYAAGPEAANKKHRNEWLIIDGEVADKDKEWGTSIYLKGSGKVRVRCVVNPFEKQLFAPLQPGQHAKLLGQYARTSGNTDTEVGLYDCLPITTSK
jgi:hypothetical protein